MPRRSALPQVTVTLKKVTVPGALATPPLELRWRKRCGVTRYKHLDVYVGADRHKAVEAGVVVSRSSARRRLESSAASFLTQRNGLVTDETRRHTGLVR